MLTSLVVVIVYAFSFALMWHERPPRERENAEEEDHQ